MNFRADSKEKMGVVQLGEKPPFVLKTSPGLNVFNRVICHIASFLVVLNSLVMASCFNGNLIT